jgi:class 3 adenylate cyclase
MLCVKCKTENPDGLKFCNECGAIFLTPCASCGFENVPAAKFCGQCGSALRSAPTAAAKEVDDRQVRVADAPASEILEGERKTVTALFADIKGSTELMEELDPEEARAIIDPTLKIMVEAVRRYEGYVVQSTGDGIFALFGAPVAHEDHPQRALYAALQMQAEFRQYGRRQTGKGMHALEARIGVNTGEVVVRTVETGGKVEYAPVGHVVNLASRLQSVAPVASIAIGEDTQRLVEGYFELRELGR